MQFSLKEMALSERRIVVLPGERRRAHIQRSSSIGTYPKTGSA
jgi:hypothetical protein